MASEGEQRQCLLASTSQKCALLIHGCRPLNDSEADQKVSVPFGRRDRDGGSGGDGGVAVGSREE